MTKFHFIHIPKTAGLSLTNTLCVYDGGLYEDITRSTIDTLPKKYYSNLVNTFGSIKKSNIRHARFRDLEVKEERKFFTVIRNPWDRVVSRYKQMRRLTDSSESFKKFLERRHEFGKKEFYWHRAIDGWYNQKDYIVDAQGNYSVDVIRFKYLEQDLQKYLNREIHLKHVNRSNGESYQRFYNNKTIQIVADWYEEDISFFGFDFDSEATKNIWQPCEHL